MIKINFISLNIRGINDPNKVQFLKDFLGNQRVDVCFLQETHLNSSDYVDELSKNFSNYFCFFTLNFDKTKGVGILINKNISHDINILSTQYDLDSRFLRVEIKIENYYLNLVNIYAPNVENEQFEFINKMYDVCASVKNIILAGDFNAVTKAKDRIGSKVQKLKKYETYWNNFIKNLNLVECNYDKVLSSEDKMTWSNGAVSSKIDKIFYFKDLNGKFLYSSIKETCKSDHKAVFADFKLRHESLNNDDVNSNEKPRKYRPWRMNDKILEDKSVIEGVEETCKKIKNYKDKYGKLWYDFFISDIINFLKKKNVEYNENVNRLNKELFKEIENFNKTKFNCNGDYVNKKNELRNKIDSFYEEKKRSLEKRFRDERRNFCKQPTKSLIQNISERNNSNEIRIYKKSNNEETSNKQEILDDLFDFYQDLLGNERVKEEITKSYKFKIKKLEQTIKDKYPEIGMKITFGEVWEVIKNMKESSPGNNGLSIGFFKKIFPLFGEDFVEILNDSESILPETFNETVIKLIMKNHNKIKNKNDLRPISLTNFEYRIYTKVLANRLRKVSPYLFLDYQTCSVSGRRINDCLNIIKDVIYDANLTGDELYVVSIDQRKAFDSMSHNYLFALLDHVDINSFLTNSIKRIYNQSFASLVVDKYISKSKIYILGGIKQGCALSMFAYTLGIEELVVNIHENKNINGYKIPKMINSNNSNDLNEIKATMYADDTGGIVKNLKSVEYFFVEFKKWGKVSGASMNEDKTKILGINSCYEKFRNINFVENLKMLGITFDKKGISSINLENCKKKIENTLNLWNGFRFNMIDKITVLKTFGLSKLWYLLNFISLDEQEIKNLEHFAFKYIWDNRAETIKREILYADFKGGGLNMINIRAKIKSISIRNLLYIKLNMNRPQYQFCIYWMKFLFKEYLNNFNILPIGLETHRPKLYKDMIETSKNFSEKYVKWCDIENERRRKIHESRMKKISDKNKIIAFVPYSNKFLINSGLLNSKLIYNLFLVDFSLVKGLDYSIDKNEQEFIYANVHKSLNSSKVRLTNYKLIHHGLATNTKFKNRYDRKCFMCKKALNENSEHIFVKCALAEKFYEYIKMNFMIKKSLQNSLVLLKFKRKIAEKDYKVLSCYVYCVWRVRNECKHQDIDDPFETFKVLFNKWYLDSNL
jgi:exonuclease III